MKNYFKHVNGKNSGNIVLYAISTCLWCKKSKRLLNDLGIEYYYVDVDLISESLKQEIREEVIRWKGKAAYPCIVIKNKIWIVAYDEDRIRKELGV